MVHVWGLLKVNIFDNRFINFFNKKRDILKNIYNFLHIIYIYIYLKIHKFKIFHVVSPKILEDQTSSDTDVREGSDVSLRCKASGSPTPDIRWRREDEKDITLGTKKGMF